MGPVTTKKNRIHAMTTDHKDTRFTVRLTPEVAELLASASAQSGIPRSQLINDVLRAGLAGTIAKRTQAAADWLERLGSEAEKRLRDNQRQRKDQ